jgi:hypothetical protein
MAIKHQLYLEIPDTNNVKVFRVSDTSIYADSLERKCPTLQITSPGYSNPVDIEVLTGFNLVLNACTLGMLSSGCDEESPQLPDGVYKLRYSISPNDKIYVDYYHLRVSQTLNILNNEYGKLELAACEPNGLVKEKLVELRLIDSYIRAAKVWVEDRHDIDKGMELLLYAKKKLMSYTTKC